MRTLPVVLAVVLVNDVVLLLALDVAVPPWLVVLGAALALTAPVLAAVRGTVGGGTLSRAEQQREVERLRERVTALEGDGRRGNN